MPDVVGVLQRAQSSCHPNLVELLHQRLQLGAAVRGEDANVHSLLVQAPQEQLRRKWLHFPRVLNLEKNHKHSHENNYVSTYSDPSIANIERKSLISTFL